MDKDFELDIYDTVVLAKSVYALRPQRDLQPGDVVRCGKDDEPFDTAIVEKVENGLVCLVRPYMHYDGFGPSLTGHEHFVVYADSDRKFFVYTTLQRVLR